jgi:hypothetical protein
MWHAQLAHHTYWGLKRRTSWPIEVLPWNSPATLSQGEYLLTFLPNKNYSLTDKIIGIENDTMLQSRWENVTVTHFGQKFPIDDLRSLEDHLTGKAGAYFLTNDVAIKRIQMGLPDARARINRLASQLGGNFSFGPHPVNKTEYGQVVGRIHRRNQRMLVLNRGWRKNSKAILQQASRAGWRTRMRTKCTKWVDKSTPTREISTLTRFGIVASASTSESGPINLLECLHRGCIVVGQSDWWDGYGFEETVFSYDPNQHQRNIEKLRYLLNPANCEEITAKRDAVLKYHNARQDNEWDTYVDRLIQVIRHATKL